MAPRYTILLPTHNRADVVGLAIQSVLDQSESDFELLVVGDGCTDGTAEVVEAFRDPRLRWFDLPKAPGFGYANRNVALRQATGELVAFMAHDDLLLPDHLASMAARFADPGVEWAYSRPLWVTDDGVVIPFAVDLRVPEQLNVFLTDHNSIPASCVVYRRSLHERVGLWPEEVTQSADWEMWKRMVAPASGSNLAYVRAPTTLHFRADWRAGPSWGPPPLVAWLSAAHAPSWPASLRFTVDGGSPQRALAGALAEPQTVTALRAGVDQAIDLMAWTQAIQIQSLQQTEADMRTRTDQLRAELVELRAEHGDALRTIPFKRVIQMQRRLQVRFGANPLAKSDSFSPRAYLAANPDVEASGMDPLDHYYVHGMLEGRSTR